MLRWSHFALFSLALFSFLGNIDSEIKPIDENKDGKIDQYEIASAELRRRNRDSVWKIMSRILDTISVFLYQGAVFYVQLNVYKNQQNCDPVTGDCRLEPPKNAYMIWLYIEMYCFYFYLLSSVFYIMYHQFVNGICCKRDSDKSDMNKAFTDFVIYAHANLVWFAFNFVLVVMPLAAIFLLQNYSEHLDRKNADMSYLPLVIVLGCANLVQFVLRPAIFDEQRRKTIYEQNEQATEDEYNDTLLIQDEDEHYVWMEKVFLRERMWTWILNLITYLAVIIVYFTVDGHEMTYCVYLPLDFLLNASKAAYYFIHYHNDNKRIQEKAHTKEVIRKRYAKQLANRL